MEFLNKSFLQTSTQIAVGSNSLLADRIMSRDATKQYFSSGYNSDSLTASITITFDTTQSVSRLALAGLNLKEFSIFYNGVTANTFALTSTGATTTSSWNANSETAMFLTCTPVTNVTSITIDMKKTQVANVEKSIGYLYIGSQLLDFERIPAASQFTPKIDSEEIVHKMSDGGTKINVKDRKHVVDIKFKYVSRTFRDSLYDVYTTDDEFAFVAFPTTTAWDEIMFPCVWEGDFDFHKYSDNNPGAGFDGMIRLRETPT